MRVKGVQGRRNVMVEGMSDRWYELPDEDDECECGLEGVDCECLSEEDWAEIAADMRLSELRDEGY